MTWHDAVLWDRPGFVRRLGAAADAFLLKILLEELVGYPVELISDGLIAKIPSALNLTGPASVYSSLASGEVDMYPEVPCEGVCDDINSLVRLHVCCVLLAWGGGNGGPWGDACCVFASACLLCRA